jgi:hypothetical protein
MKKEMRRYLSKTKLPGCYDRLVKLIPGLHNPIGSAHANREKTWQNHTGVHTPGVSVIDKIS